MRNIFMADYNEYIKKVATKKIFVISFKKGK